MASASNGEIEIALFDELASTSDFLKEHPELWHTNYYTACARSQTQGRGRGHNSWLMQSDKDLAFTMVLHFHGTAREAVGLTPFIGYSLQQILSRDISHESQSADRLLLKWPNDILVADKKLCGILCEYTAGTQNVLLIGVGINVNSNASSNDARAISMKEIAGGEFSLESMRREVPNALAQSLNRLPLPYSTQFCADWYQNCARRNTLVRWISDSGAAQQGYIAGIDTLGRLLVLDEAQKIHCVTQDIEWSE